MALLYSLGIFIVQIAVLTVTVGFMALFTWKNHFPVDGRTVVITGGSQGMGRGLAKLLAQKGAHVVIVARDIKKLEAARDHIAEAARDPQSQQFHWISADLTDPAESVRVLEEVTAWNHNSPPDIVWANAGFSEPGLFIEKSVDQLRSQMDVNYWAATYTAHATLKAWLRPVSSSTRPGETPTSGDKQPSPPPRHLIFTSSVLAFYTLVGYTNYSPAKAAMRSLSDTLTQEMNLYNGARRHDPSLGPTADVKIHTVFPGTIYSPGYDNESQIKPAITRKLEESDPGQTEDEVAAASLRGLEKGDYLVTVGFLGSAMRGCAWGGSPRNNWVVDTLMTWATSLVWMFVQRDMDGKVWDYGKKNGLPVSKSP
ncbi:MAG: 3-dehydrosphinganine reductase [Pycnora praestabilis]|nr:MAG: 3-dehydrosphinganine reductase [Pycnora praestabilis]